MSHNKFTVAGQSPNANSEISVALNNLSDINISSVQDNDYLVYDSTAGEFQNAAVPSVAAQILRIGNGESNAYSNSGATSIGANDTLRVYDTSPINTITGATLSEYSNSDWYDSFTLPAGDYAIISCQFNVEFSASGYASLTLEDSSNDNYTFRSVIGENANTLLEGASTVCTGLFTLSSSKTLHLELKDVSNVANVASQANTVSEYTSIIIQKVS